MRKGKVAEMIKKIFLLYVIYVAVCCILPPLFHKKAEQGNESRKVQGAETAERVLCIDDNGEALLWRLRVIEEAGQEVVLSTFDLRADESGQDVMAALYAAAGRGVKVKILVDGIPGSVFLRGNRTFLALTSHPLVEAKLYNPPDLLRPWKINYRMHDKYLIADDKVYILGGRNTNDLFLGKERENQNIDRDILVFPEETGGSLGQLKAYFEEIWEEPCCKTVSGERTAPEESTVKKQKRDRFEQEKIRLAERYEELQECCPEAFTGVDWREETAEAEGVFLLTNGKAAARKEPRVWQELNKIMTSGQEIFVETPYMICDREMYRDIVSLKEGGRRLQIMLNAPEGGANPFGCADYLDQKGNIRRTGCEIYEWNGGHSLHTKTFLIDDRISVVGSFNLDSRSAYLDTEMMLVIDSPALNRSLRESALDKIKESRYVPPAGEGYPEETGEFSFFETLRRGFLRFLIRPFRHLL